jgi:hypothetical protein
MSSFEHWDFQGQFGDGLAENWMMQEGIAYPVLSAMNGWRPPTPEGDGSASDPYRIDDLNDLPFLIWHPDVHYRLQSGIDLAGLSLSAAMVPTFTGHLDGAGHEVRGLTETCDQSQGGLIGRIEAGALVENLAIVDANVQATQAAQNMGILAGTNSGTLLNCRATGVIEGQKYLGGLIGLNSGVLWGCSVALSIKGDTYVGGLTGREEGTITASFWDMQTSGVTASGGGSGNTTALMNMGSTFRNAGWDLTNIWTICEGKDYPRLKWENAACPK